MFSLRNKKNIYLIIRLNMVTHLSTGLRQSLEDILVTIFISIWAGWQSPVLRVTGNFYSCCGDIPDYTQLKIIQTGKWMAVKNKQNKMAE